MAGTIILHVEDDENDVYFVRHAFRKAAPGAALVNVGDGEAAEAYLAGRPPFGDRAKHPFPDLVLMDLKLPRKTGLEVLRWLRGEAALRALPVVVLSSSREKADVERAYELGANSYVSKEPSLRALADILRGVVALAEEARAARPSPS